MREKPTEEIVEDIQECYDRRGKFNGKIINKEPDLVCRKTIYNKFGSLKDGAKAANVPLYHPQENEDIAVKCQWCESTIQRQPYRLEVSDNQFCDYECQGKWLSENVVGENHPLYTGGEKYQDKHGAMWHKRREERLDIDNHECVSCGMTNEEHREKYGRELDVHHVVPRRRFIDDENKDIDEANKMKNLRSVCRECHVQIENGIKEIK